MPEFRTPHSPLPTLGRRAFLKTSLAVGAALPAWGLAADDKSRVVAATSSKVFGDGNALKQDAAQDLVDAAVCSLTGEKSAAAAWRHFVKPNDTVGIKASCLAGERLSTRIEIVRAIARGLQAAEVRPQRILVWDRKLSDLTRAGYPAEGGDDFRLVGNDDRVLGFAPPLIEVGEIGSFFSKLVTDTCSVIINVPVLKDHDLAGVTVCLKSFFGAIHNPNKYHFANLHQAIADVNRHDDIRRKTVLHLCDATFGCYHGGPTPPPKWIERLGTLYASRDPVALDQVAWQKIEELRKANNLETLLGSKREPKHIALAAEAKLGTNDPNRIELVRAAV
ncbi:MAG TPA: DUF362 domain-containing protein [Planctomycetota bacterium]|nr:DUF362 domain-containing protein [Planctomycetota bacterium]HRR80927.1 DUF362 domain-containing protein [Planctomycetota bacterium]HRT93869.1 DUF362 domain-containing protein [Planctomycetota bacterium]